MRGNDELARGARERSPAREAVFVGSAHIRRCWRTSSATSTASTRCRPESTSSEWRAACLARGARRPARRGAPRPAEPGQRERAAARRGERRAPGGVPRRRPADRPLLREAALQQGRPRSARGAAGLDARAVIVGFGDYRAELERLGRRARSSPARSSTGTSSHLLARRRHRRPVDLSGGIRHGRRRGGGCRLAAARRAPLGPRRNRRRAGGGVPGPLRAACELRDRRRGRPCAKLRGCSRSRTPIESATRQRPGSRRQPLGWAGVARRLLEPFTVPSVHG